MMKKLIATVRWHRGRSRAQRAYAMAAVSAAEAAKLGAELTPLGGEKAANADGSIPGLGRRHHLARRRRASRTSARASITPIRTPATSRCTPITAANMGQYAQQAHRRSQEAAADLSRHFQDERVSHASQRRGSAAHLRRDQAHCDHRAARDRRQRRHERGRGHSLPDSEGRRRGVLEPRAALSRRRHRAPDRPGARDRERRVHDGQVPRRDHGRVQPAGREVREPRQHHRVLHPGDRGARAPRRRSAAGAGDARPVDRESPRLGLQPRPAPRAPRAERRVRQSGHELRQPAHVRPVRHVQRQPAALRLDAGRQERNPRARTTATSCTRTRSSTPTSSRRTTSTRISRATSCIACGSWIRS